MFPVEGLLFLNKCFEPDGELWQFPARDAGADRLPPGGVGVESLGEVVQGGGSGVPGRHRESTWRPLAGAEPGVLRPEAQGGGAVSWETGLFGPFLAGESERTEPGVE